VLLPFVVTTVVPAFIVLPLDARGVGWGLPAPLGLLPSLIGGGLIGSGLLLVYRTVSLFATEGEGTLAPWDPPRRLVVRGPYRRVRNPMISGVLAILLGEATLLGSVPLFAWFLTFLSVNAISMPLLEEPSLEKRFGGDYLAYKANVPRWIPRWKPWTPVQRPSNRHRCR
jgi:protein-S-isoprenylcysteine O-methyltransferase Ste14